MIVFEASAVVSAALREDSGPGRALLHAEATDLFALSAEVDAEIAEVVDRRRFVRAVTAARRTRSLEVLRGNAVWFTPAERVTDCRDVKDNKYLKLALAAEAGTIVNGDADLLVLDPWRGVRILKPAAYLAKSEAGLKWMVHLPPCCRAACRLCPRLWGRCFPPWSLRRLTRRPRASGSSSPPRSAARTPAAPMPVP